MKPTFSLALSTTLFVLALGTTRAFAGGSIDPEGAKKLKSTVDELNEKALKDFDLKHKVITDPGKLECYHDYNEATRTARQLLAACLRNPSPQSPLGKFNAMTNVQMATFCGNKTLGQCAADVHQSQLNVCLQASHYLDAIDAAQKREARCIECDALQDELKALTKKINDKGCARLVQIPPTLIRQ